MKLAVVMLSAMLLIVGCGSNSNRPNRQNVRVNNDTCPVTGNQVNDQDTYTYKGKEYRLCSKKCKQSLSENPKKYLAD